jgi:hypothetical protein
MNALPVFLHAVDIIDGVDILVVKWAVKQCYQLPTPSTTLICKKDEHDFNGIVMQGSEEL